MPIRIFRYRARIAKYLVVSFTQLSNWSWPFFAGAELPLRVDSVEKFGPSRLRTY